MASNDEQIDLLVRRLGARAFGVASGGSHLDADEMNAFAEGALPPPARARYVSHLAECDQCRRQVADLAIASGAVAQTEQTLVDKPARAGFWASLAGLFAMPTLRYAAFAAIVIMVGGLAFFALRQRNQSPTNLVAENHGDQSQSSAVKPGVDANSGGSDVNGQRAENAPSLPAPAATQPPAAQPLGGSGGKQEEVRPADTITTAPVEPMKMKEAAKNPEEAEKKAEPPVVAGNIPFSPAPPTETVRVQTQSGAVASAPGGPRQQQQQIVTQSADKPAPSDRERAMNKDARLDDANTKSAQGVLANRANDDKLRGGPSRNMDNSAINNRAGNETLRREAPKTEGRDEAEAAAQTRSAGGHKFRRQGKAWVDQKFKSSMSLKNVARGSEEFSSLDSGIRSIAQQISGEVIVVWKGKAYLIK